MSVAAGIPDFRTPGTGLYDNLEKYNLPHPTAVFDVDFYKSNPNPFVALASEIWPGNHLPTLTHAFIKVLSDKGLLMRNYTQNIDGLEFIAGVRGVGEGGEGGGASAYPLLAGTGGGDH